MEEIKNSIENINREIEDAFKKSGRSKEDRVELIGVSKTVDAKKINEAIECGVKIIGESRVQEFLIKNQELLPVKKHFIGSLQTNKVKDIINIVSMIHSVDRKSLAKKISAEARKNNIEKFKILLQVNIGEEKSKSGVLKEDIDYLLEEILEYDNINLCGFMTIPPISTGDRARFYYEELREIKDRVATEYKKDFLDMKELSMGMSGDYKEAILEGATLVRVGRKIFGDRLG